MLATSRDLQHTPGPQDLLARAKSSARHQGILLAYSQAPGPPS